MYKKIYKKYYLYEYISVFIIYFINLLNYSFNYKFNKNAEIEKKTFFDEERGNENNDCVLVFGKCYNIDYNYYNKVKQD
jgi:hypothetical protein